MSTVGILNVGAGDTKISFDKRNPQDRIRAARIVKDMLRRGYALLVEVRKGEYQRVHEFDEKRCEYIIADFDPVEAAATDAKPGQFTDKQWDTLGKHGQTSKPEALQARAAPGAGKGNGRRRRGRRVAAESVRGVAVGRTAGG